MLWNQAGVDEIAKRAEVTTKEEFGKFPEGI